MQLLALSESEWKSSCTWVWRSWWKDDASTLKNLRLVPRISGVPFYSVWRHSFVSRCNHRIWKKKSYFINCEISLWRLWRTHTAVVRGCVFLWEFVATGARRWITRVQWGILRGCGKSSFRWIQKGTLHIRFCWQVLHMANIITHATSIRKLIGTYHNHKTFYLKLVLGIHKRIKKYFNWEVRFWECNPNKSR